MKKKIRISMALVLGLGLLICTVAAAFVFEARFTSRAKEDKGITLNTEGSY